MNLGEKIYQLRRQKGLSQEELGDKLNVTRQTVSKWELGQSIPEAKKLDELCEFFEVSKENLTNNSFIIENQNVARFRDVEDLKPRKWLLVVLLLIAVGIIVILSSKVVSDYKKRAEAREQKNAITNYNATFEKHRGMTSGTSLSELIGKLITNNNNKNNKIISLTLDGVNAKTEEELNSLKENIETTTIYAVAFQYDDSGFVKHIDAKKTVQVVPDDSDDFFGGKEISASSFNFTLEHHGGTSVGFSVNSLLDQVNYLNSKYPNHIITVTFRDITATVAEEIRNIKDKIDEWADYKVKLENDEAGYINKITITKK